MKNKAVILSTIITLFLAVTSLPAVAGPYAPAAGEPGSTAIHMDDLSFVAWATGWQDYVVGSDVDVTWQTPDKALGQAVGISYDIVSLGRGGEITLTFDNPIVDGAGYDFAVFENSFSDIALELAYVEVSADGSNWYRFDNYSLTSNPVGAYGTIDPTDVYQLGCKYIQGYGEQYDLDDLGLDKISYVRILDVVGDGNYLDSNSHIIYDAYPTWGSAGFDLDAVGVLHQGSPVPIPGAVWLLGSGLLGIVGIRRKKTA